MSITEILLIINVAVVACVAYYLFTKGSKPDNSKDAAFQMLQTQLNELTRSQEGKLEKMVGAMGEQQKELTARLSETNKTINEQLNRSQVSILRQFEISQKSVTETNETAGKLIKDVTEQLTKLDETNKQVVNFAGQLQSLQNILKNPKQRGILGEYYLQTTLENVLPPGTFQMQYKFSNGETVDAAVFIKDKILPIDSKFSLENYNRILNEQDEGVKKQLEVELKNDLKKRIEETSKYIRPDENTMDFAFMFIPSEALYYDLLINKVGTLKIDTNSLVTYAFAEKKVIIVSPTTFLAYLQTVLQGLRALQIEESTQSMLNGIKKLKDHLDKFDDDFNKVGKHLGTTINAYNSSFKNFKQIDKDVFKITGDKMAIQSETVSTLSELDVID